MSEVYYNDNNYTGGGETPENLNQYKKGFAITAFVLSLVNLLCCCAFSYVLATLAIIFAIISLATHRGGKGLAIAGLIIAGIALIAVIIVQVIFGEAIQDYVKFIQNGDAYVQMWDETGETPDEFSKYYDEKYDSWWESMGFKSFREFYGEVLIKAYKQQFPNGQNGQGYGSSTSEEPVDLCA
ncbi:MAG: hypothetical protein IJ874_08490 [Ruminococcus sp.]|nr:hypothetical protein [Ruminococcus sp.]